jgi:hypothetical protein
MSQKQLGFISLTSIETWFRLYHLQNAIGIVQMMHYITIFLLILFSIHLLVFLRLTFKHKRTQFLLATIAFTLLTLSNALRLWRPGMILAGHNPFAWLRFIALSSTAGSVALFIRNKVK